MTVYTWNYQTPHVTYRSWDMLGLHSNFVLRHFMPEWWEGVENPILLLSRCHGGASSIMRRRDGENCCSRNSFLWEDNLQLGNRPFYVPPSPVIGCHWSCVRGKRLHGSFPDFPGDVFFSLPPLHSHSIWRSNRHATLSAFSLKFYSPCSHSKGAYCSAAPLVDVKDECWSFRRIWPVHTP